MRGGTDYSFAGVFSCEITALAPPAGREGSPPALSRPMKNIYIIITHRPPGLGSSVPSTFRSSRSGRGPPVSSRQAVMWLDEGLCMDVILWCLGGYLSMWRA